MPDSSVNPNLKLLVAIIFATLGIMIGCEMMFHDASIFTMLSNFISLLIGVLVGAFKNVFHIPDSPPPTSQTTVQVTKTVVPAPESEAPKAA